MIISDLAGYKMPLEPMMRNKPVETAARLACCNPQQQYVVLRQIIEQGANPRIERPRRPRFAARCIGIFIALHQLRLFGSAHAGGQPRHRDRQGQADDPEHSVTRRRLKPLPFERPLLFDLALRDWDSLCIWLVAGLL